MSVYTYCLLISLLFLLLILYFIKKRILEFKYSVLWLLTSGVMIILSIDRNAVEYLASLTGISYPPAFLFVTGIIFMLFLLFYMTLVISDVQRKLTRQIQEIGIIKSRQEAEK